MQTKLNKLPKATIELEVTVPVSDVKNLYEEVIKEKISTTELKGFRKGTAPRNLVEESLDTSELYGEIINKLLQKYYPQAIKENHIEVIANPKVEVKEFALDKDFVFTATVATRPEVKVGDFRKGIKEQYEKQKETAKAQNAEKLKAGEKIESDHIHLNPNTVVEEIIKVTQVEVPDLLIDEEADRITSRLVDQAQAVGISLDQYLKANNKTAEDLRKEHKALAERNLIAEFALNHLLKQEKIEATEQEIEETAKATGDPEAIESIKDPLQKWYIKNILEKNMLINKLIEEVEGEHTHE